MQRKYFKVRGSHVQKGRTWKKNIEYNVVCNTALDAMEFTKQEHPEIEIHSVQLSGSIDYIAPQDA